MPDIISFTEKWHNEPYPFISPTRPELSAAGKNVVITGGGTGIGNAIAVAFAQAGAKSVAILGRREEKLKNGAANISAAASKGTQVLYETADLLDLDKTNTAFESIVTKVGNIDVLVSNAGELPPPGPIVDSNGKKLVAAISSSILAVFHSFQAFESHAGPEPILLHTSSCMANMSPTPGMGAYSVSKAATTKLVDFIAVENPNLHAVNVQPGWVATDINGHQKEATDSGVFIPFLLARVISPIC